MYQDSSSIGRGLSMAIATAMASAAILGSVACGSDEDDRAHYGSGGGRRASGGGGARDAGLGGARDAGLGGRLRDTGGGGGARDGGGGGAGRAGRYAAGGSMSGSNDAAAAGAADAFPDVPQDTSESDASLTDATLEGSAECAIPGVAHVPPLVPDPILPPSGVNLVGGYRASGVQIYSCSPNPSDAGGEAGAWTGTWVNTAIATLFGDNCTPVGHHQYSPGPTWTATDGSMVEASRVAAVPAPSTDGGDGGTSAITWVLLRAESATGVGLFGEVTYVQRVNTWGGAGPTGTCDATTAAVHSVPYQATYYFYERGSVPLDSGSEVDSSEDAADAY